MIRGWCPTVHAPMPSGDGLLARVKPFGGRLPAPALAALADAASRYGNGIVELTRRGNLQVRGVHDPARFARATVEAGLADPDPVREARRNVVTVPPCDDAVVAEVEAVLADMAGLPAKFYVVVQGATVFVRGEAVEVGALRDALVRVAKTLTPALSLREREKTATSFLLPLPCFTGEGRGEGASPAHLLYLPFHQTTAPTLAHLATISPEIRTTPWRAFLSPVPVPGFATEPGTITACPGAPGCSSATVPARADAALLQAAGFANLHVSGCAKGCAHQAAATTLVGRDGRYDLIRHGRASDPAERHGLTLAEAMAAL